MDRGMLVKVCYLDFSKAFDSVRHHLLMQKLECFGVSGTLKNWVADFLHDRTFRVRVGECDSDVARVTSGVPQGSVLGPLLSLMFINDLAEDLTNACFIFADDVKLAGTDIESDIKKVFKWAQDWDLTLNIEKCQVLNWSRRT